MTDSVLDSPQLSLSMRMRLAQGDAGRFTVQELARLLRCSREVVEDKIAAARVPAYPTGRWVLYRLGDVADLFRDGRDATVGVLADRDFLEEPTPAGRAPKRATIGRGRRSRGR